MSYSFDQRLERAIGRRNPYGRHDAFGMKVANAMDAALESYSTRGSSSASKYALLAMSPVDEDCARRSREAGDRVIQHLTKAFEDKHMTMPQFKYQGSVVANTQIKGASDIDLLVLDQRSYRYDKGGIEKALDALPNAFPPLASSVKLRRVLNGPEYKGDSLSDVKQDRRICEECLSSVYDQCNISKAKAIQILNQNLNQKVDVVNCLWYDDVRSVANDQIDPYRGITIYDKKSGSFLAEDYPFYKIDLINKRDEATRGNFKCMIRLLKTLKEDADNCSKLSSFDIYSILYEMPVGTYSKSSRLGLIDELIIFMHPIATNTIDANEVKQLDTDDYVFRNNAEKLQDFRRIYQDLCRIKCEIRNSMRRIVFG